MILAADFESKLMIHNFTGRMKVQTHVITIQIDVIPDKIFNCVDWSRVVFQIINLLIILACPKISLVAAFAITVNN